MAYVGASSPCPCPTSSDQTQRREPGRPRHRGARAPADPRAGRRGVASASCASSAPVTTTSSGSCVVATWSPCTRASTWATPGHSRGCSEPGWRCLPAGQQRSAISPRCPNPPSAGLIHVAIGHRRSVRPPARVVVHRMAGFDQRTNWLRSPPRVRLEHAAIDVRSGQDLQWQTGSGSSRMPARPGRPLRRHRRRVEATAGGCRAARFSLELPARSRDGCLLGPGARLPRARTLARDCRIANRQQADRLAGRTILPRRVVRRFRCQDRARRAGLPRQRRCSGPRRRRAISTPWSLTTRSPFGSPTARSSTAAARPPPRSRALLVRRGWPGPFVRCPACP